jgi:hypothetical protein
VAFLVEREGVVLLRRARNSALGNGGTLDGGGEAGMEMDEARSKGLEVEAASASQDFNDSFKTGGVEGVGMDPIDKMSGSTLGTTISRCMVPSRE